MERSAIHDELQSFLRPLCEQMQLELRIFDPYEGLGNGSARLHPGHARYVAKEAERCLQRSAATAVIGLIGDLYEQSPLPEEIAEDEFASLRAFLVQNLTGSEAHIAGELLSRW